MPNSNPRLAALVMLLAKIQEMIKLPVSIKALGAFLRCVALKKSSVVFAKGERKKSVTLDAMIKIHCQIAISKLVILIIPPNGTV